MVRRALLTQFFCLAFAGLAHAQYDTYDGYSYEEEDLGVLSQTRSAKGYFKRDRILLEGTKSISPSQLHEVYGLRYGGGFGIDRSSVKLNGERADVSAPQIRGRVLYGGDQLVLGAELTHLQSAVDKASSDLNEDFRATKFMPKASWTILDHITVGVGTEINRLDFSEKNQLETNRTYDFRYRRDVLGVSYHTAEWEVGAVYYTDVQITKTSDRTSPERFSLANNPSAYTRSIYIPSQSMVYARGNLTDEFSLLGTLGFSRYDGNVEGAVGAFERYRRDDRLLSKLQGTYWLLNRSRLSASLDYQGGATAEEGDELGALGYNLASLYGGSLEGVASFQKQTYIGLNLRYMRGEEFRVVEGQRYSSRENTFRIATSILLKL